MKNSTKISISIFAIAIGSIAISEYSSTAIGNAAGPTQAVAGDPKSGNKTCAMSGCHVSNGVDVTFPLTGVITSNVPVAGYTPGATYTFTATMTRAGHTRFGFEISPQNSAGVFQGTLTATDATNTRLPFIFVGGAVATGKYITHKVSTADTWSFDWTAPAAGTGDVIFYGAFNAAGGSTNETGDSIFTSSTLVSENVASGIDDLANSSASISIYPNPVTDKFIVSNSLNAAGSLSISISNASGVIVKKIQNAAAYQTIDIADLADGVYFLRIETSEGEVIKKIVKE